MVENKYDSTQDTYEHITAVRKALVTVRWLLELRGLMHDNSKRFEPEKSMYDKWVPKLREAKYGSDEYKAALAGMGEGLRHHYALNPHHPEHFNDGIKGMSLIDVIEMVCDWHASATARGKPVNVQANAERFGIPPELVAIIENTLRLLA